MDERMLNDKNPRIIFEENLGELGINLDEFEMIEKGETPLKIKASLMHEGIATAKKCGGDLLVLSNERNYGGTFVDKYQYHFEIYKSKKRG